MAKKVVTSKKSGAKTKDNLNMRQELFCELYISTDREMFGNGVQCYIEAYDFDITVKGAYDTARINASRLLTKANIIKRINDNLSSGGFTEENVDRQHLFLVNQHGDLRTKMQAIKEFNALKKRIVNRLDLTSGGKPLPLFDNVTNKKDVSNNDGDAKD